tara:strand:+ start:292 stop:1080 length:789 start_codon:yes stop_codon:yes gene_type:complete
MMFLLVSGLLATFVLFATGLKQFNAFQKGHIRDLPASMLGVLGLALSVLVLFLGFEANGWRPTTGLMGTLLGILLLTIIMVTSLAQPVNALLIGAAPLTGLFTALSAVFIPPETIARLNFETALHVGASLVAYGAVAYSGALSFLVSWHHKKLKKRPLNPLIAALPPLDAMEQLFLHTVQVAWIALTLALASGILYVQDFWGQHLAHKTLLSGLAWLGMTLALWQHYQEGGVTKTMRKTAIGASILLCIGYLGSKAILEFLL